MRSTCRCAVPWSRLTALASLASAGGGLGRAYSRGLPFSIFFSRKLRFFYPTLYLVPPHYHRNIRVKGQSAVDDIFAAEARERGCATQPTSICLLIPNVKDEIYLLRDCIVSFMVSSYGAFMDSRGSFSEHVPTRTLLLLLAAAPTCSSWSCDLTLLDVSPHPKPERRDLPPVGLLFMVLFLVLSWIPVALPARFSRTSMCRTTAAAACSCINLLVGAADDWPLHVRNMYALCSRTASNCSTCTMGRVRITLYYCCLPHAHHSTAAAMLLCWFIESVFSLSSLK